MRKLVTILVSVVALTGMICLPASLFAADNPILPPKLLKVVANDIPGILTQPENQFTDLGRTATFHVTATGQGPLSYSWTFNGRTVGTDSPTYDRSNTSMSDNEGRVRVTVSNANGSVQSMIAILRVRNAGVNYYVSPSGSSANTGLSPSSPWSLSQALSRVGRSNTINLLPGTYPSINLSQDGLTLRATEKWAAKVVGSPGVHGVYTMDGVDGVQIEGIQVVSSYIDGIKINGHNATVRGCWVKNAGKGHPSATVNSSGAYTGQGIAAHGFTGTVIEYNLVENCGVFLTQDHGMYVHGTNNIIRGNVVRNNLGWGIQLYDTYGDNKNAVVNNNLIYGNGQGALTVWSKNRNTNYVFNNTLIAPAYCLVSEYGRLVVANNIIMGSSSWHPCIASSDGSIVYGSYNLFNKGSGTGDPRGSTDIVSSNPGFLNAAKGLYWLTASSPARGKARRVSSVLYPNFFDDTDLGPASRDLGAFEYDPSFEADARTLTPGSTSPNYWSRTLD